MAGKSLTVVTESKVFAIQEQEVVVKATRKEIWKEEIEDVSCRLCKTDNSRICSLWLPSASKNPILCKT